MNVIYYALVVCSIMASQKFLPSGVVAASADINVQSMCEKCEPQCNNSDYIRSEDPPANYRCSSTSASVYIVNKLYIIGSVVQSQSMTLAAVESKTSFKYARGIARDRLNIITKIMQLAMTDYQNNFAANAPVCAFVWSKHGKHITYNINGITDNYCQYLQLNLFTPIYSDHRSSMSLIDIVFDVTMYLLMSICIIACGLGVVMCYYEHIYQTRHHV